MIILQWVASGRRELKFYGIGDFSPRSTYASQNLTHGTEKILCCIYRSQPEMSLAWPETEMSCMAGAEMSCMAGAEVSRMAGDGDVLYGRRR